MKVSRLRLTYFKNHEERNLEFCSQINCFVGNNGVGKTNILDALHYLSVGKSFLGNTDINNIATNQDFFCIEGQILSEDKEDILLITQPNEGKKIIKKNDKPYNKIADHIGYLPSVIISPYDANLISDGGESRRKFLDSVISQVDVEYLHNLIRYQKTLQQRNSLLKSFQKNNYFDAESLSIYDQPLIAHGEILHEKRKNFISKISPVLKQYYQTISGGKEEISIQYDSDLNHKSFLETIKENEAKDRVITYTSRGIHKDDILFEMNQQLIKKIGSQGQQKSFLIALKLAQMNYIKNTSNKKPILLLDDIFDKLDDQRVAQLIKLVSEEEFGQIFITDTHKERTEDVVKKISNQVKIIEL